MKRIVPYREVAKYLAMPLGTVYSMVHLNMIPHIRLSTRTVRFDLDEIDEWLRARKRAPTCAAS